MMLQGDNILEVQKVSKFYARKRGAARRRVGQALWRALIGRGPATEGAMQGEFAAVDNVSFTLARGEALGIIGLNGSGKTTLLRMLAGQILPDVGEIRMVGESAAMIDLTAGFQMGASGRENVFLRGAMLGRNRAEMAAVFDEIVAFAELEEAIDAPVATYSSGMLMRLAFAIMVQMDPDILFIDETLSVGDFTFRQKCLGRLREMRERTAFVLVSHSMSDISRFCDRVIVLQAGERVFEGDPVEARKYYESSVSGPGLQLKGGGANSLAQIQINQKLIHNKKQIAKVKHFWSDREGKPLSAATVGDDLCFMCTFVLNCEYRKLTIGLAIYSEDGGYVAGFSSKETFRDTLPHRVGFNEFRLIIEKPVLNPGMYFSRIVIRDGPEYVYRQPNAELTLTHSSGDFYGAVSLRHRWEILEEIANSYR